jgi:predicted MFS family arabinose efflux permease
MNEEKRANVLILLLGIMVFWANGDNYAAAVVLTSIAADLRVDIGVAALSVSSYMLFFGLLTILFGPLGDRYGRARILTIAAFGSAAFSMASAVVADLTSLIVVRAVNGAFSAGIMPLAVAYAGDSSQSHNRQQRIGMVMGLMFLGGALATVIGGAITCFGTWRTVYLVYGIAELLVACLLVAMFKSSPRSSLPAGILSSYRSILSSGRMLRLIGLLFFIGFSTLGAFAYLGKLIQERTDLNLLLVGGILSAYGIGTLVGGRLAARLRAALGGRLFLVVGIAGAVGLSVLAPARVSAAVIVPALFVYGFGFIIFQSSIITTAQNLAPGQRGTVMSAASFTMVVSGAIGTFVNGRIISAFGFAPVLVLAALAFATAGFLAAALLREPGA